MLPIHTSRVERESPTGECTFSHVCCLYIMKTRCQHISRIAHNKNTILNDKKRF